jgi:hypothetical protein
VDKAFIIKNICPYVGANSAFTAVWFRRKVSIYQTLVLRIVSAYVIYSFVGRNSSTNKFSYLLK